MSNITSPFSGGGGGGDDDSDSSSTDDSNETSTSDGSSSYSGGYVNHEMRVPETLRDPYPIDDGSSSTSGGTTSGSSTGGSGGYTNEEMRVPEGIREPIDSGSTGGRSSSSGSTSSASSSTDDRGGYQNQEMRVPDSLRDPYPSDGSPNGDRSGTVPGASAGVGTGSVADRRAVDRTRRRRTPGRQRPPDAGDRLRRRAAEGNPFEPADFEVSEESIPATPRRGAPIAAQARTRRVARVRESALRREVEEQFLEQNPSVDPGRVQIELTDEGARAYTTPEQRRSPGEVMAEDGFVAGLRAYGQDLKRQSVENVSPIVALGLSEERETAQAGEAEIAEQAQSGDLSSTIYQGGEVIQLFGEDVGGLVAKTGFAATEWGINAPENAAEGAFEAAGYDVDVPNAVEWIADREVGTEENTLQQQGAKTVGGFTASPFLIGGAISQAVALGMDSTADAVSSFESAYQRAGEQFAEETETEVDDWYFQTRRDAAGLMGVDIDRTVDIDAGGAAENFGSTLGTAAYRQTVGLATENPVEAAIMYGTPALMSRGAGRSALETARSRGRSAGRRAGIEELVIDTRGQQQFSTGRSRSRSGSGTGSRSGSTSVDPVTARNIANPSRKAAGSRRGSGSGMPSGGWEGSSGGGLGGIGSLKRPVSRPPGFRDARSYGDPKPGSILSPTQRAKMGYSAESAALRSVQNAAMRDLRAVESVRELNARTPTTDLRATGGSATGGTAGAAGAAGSAVVAGPLVRMTEAQQSSFVGDGRLDPNAEDLTVPGTDTRTLLEQSMAEQEQLAEAASGSSFTDETGQGGAFDTTPGILHDVTDTTGSDTRTQTDTAMATDQRADLIGVTREETAPKDATVDTTVTSPNPNRNTVNDPTTGDPTWPTPMDPDGPGGGKRPPPPPIPNLPGGGSYGTPRPSQTGFADQFKNPLAGIGSVLAGGYLPTSDELANNGNPGGVDVFGGGIDPVTFETGDADLFDPGGLYTFGGGLDSAAFGIDPDQAGGFEAIDVESFGGIDVNAFSGFTDSSKKKGKWDDRNPFTALF